MIAFTFVAAYISRRIASLRLLHHRHDFRRYSSLNRSTTAHDAYWMLPIMGFGQMTLYAGYSIYFPNYSPPVCAAPASVSAITPSGI